jgi:hypothetical protein
MEGDLVREIGLPVEEGVLTWVGDASNVGEGGGAGGGEWDFFLIDKFTCIVRFLLFPFTRSKKAFDRSRPFCWRLLRRELPFDDRERVGD